MTRASTLGNNGKYFTITDACLLANGGSAGSGQQEFSGYVTRGGVAIFAGIVCIWHSVSDAHVPVCRRH